MSAHETRAGRKTATEQVTAPEWWDVKAASLYLGTSKDYVYRMAQDSLFPPGIAFRLAHSKRWRFSPAALRAWYEKSISSPLEAVQG